MSTETGFRWRALIAFLVTWAFAVATVTGIVLYVVPQGRVAYWTDWRLLALGKDDWADIHMVFGGIFIVTGALHLYFNWKPFKSYLAERIAGHIRLRREMVASLVIAVLVLGGAIAKLPPVSWVFDLNASLKALWAEAPGAEPPFGHAEELSLAGFSRRQGIDPEAAVAALTAAGFAVPGPQTSLKTLAQVNRVNPAALYAVLKPLEVPRGFGRRLREPATTNSLSAEDVEVRFAGSGLGRKTLDEVCSEAGIAIGVARTRLAAAGIAMEDGAAFRATAEAHGLTPIDLLKIIAVEGYRP